MPTNLLSTDDSTFVGGVGHWIRTEVQTTLTTATTPTPPAGGKVLVLTRNTTTSFGASVGAKIPNTIYVAAATSYTLDMQVATAAANYGTNIFAQAHISVDTGSTTYGTGFTTITGIDPGTGWHNVHIDAAAIGPIGVGWHLGIEIQFATDYSTDPPWPGAGIDGFFLNDAALVANVVLAPAPLGGWGVGQIRMGAN